MLVLSSKTKTIFSNEWLSLKDKGGYIFAHESRCHGHIVAVLGWRKKKEMEILGRFEDCPAHDNGISLSSLTGGIEEKGDWDAMSLKFAQQELREEAGIEVDKDRFVSLGTIRPLKSSDAIIHLYSIELPDEEPVEDPEGDGSQGEVGAYCEWVSLEDAIDCKDPLVHSAILRLKNAGTNK